MSTRQQLPRLLSVREASDHLGVHVNTTRRWIESGRLRAYRLRGAPEREAVRISEDDLLDVIAPYGRRSPKRRGTQAAAPTGVDGRPSWWLGHWPPREAVEYRRRTQAAWSVRITRDARDTIRGEFEKAMASGVDVESGGWLAGDAW